LSLRTPRRSVDAAADSYANEHENFARSTNSKTQINNDLRNAYVSAMRVKTPDYAIIGGEVTTLGSTARSGLVGVSLDSVFSNGFD